MLHAAIELAGTRLVKCCTMYVMLFNFMGNIDFRQAYKDFFGHHVIPVHLVPRADFILD